MWEWQEGGLNALAANDPEAIGLVAANAALHAALTALAATGSTSRAHLTRRTKWRWY